MKRPKPLTDKQKIFLLSKVNGAENHQEVLPRQHIEWPRGWLTKRLEEKRREAR